MVRWLIGGAIVLVAGYLLMPYFSSRHAITADGQGKTQFLYDGATACPKTLDACTQEIVEDPCDCRVVIHHADVAGRGQIDVSKRRPKAMQMRQRPKQTPAQAESKSGGLCFFQPQAHGDH